MPSIVAQSSPPPRLTDAHVLAALERFLPQTVIAEVVAEHLPATRRCRKLPAELTVVLTVAMNLFAHDALILVVAKLLIGVRLVHPSLCPVLPSKSAISRARKRLGSAPVEALFRRVCVPLATPATRGASLFGFRLMAIDSTQEIVADTPENVRAFGKHRTQYGRSAFPLMLVVYLVECGTHAVCGALLGKGHLAPDALARRLVQQVTSEMLVLWDCGLTCYALIAAVRSQGAHVLCRASSPLFLIPHAGLPDGSYLASVAAASPSRRTAKTAKLLVRVLVYTLDDPDRPGCGTTHRLITTLLDPVAFPARDLVLAYHERWEIEITIDELDTHQRPVGRPLRSKTPQGVMQEFYGLLLAHYLIRASMHEVACQAGIDPDRLSFVFALGLTVTLIPLAQGLDEPARQTMHQTFASDLLRFLLPPRDDRTNPRVIKRRLSKFRRKTKKHRSVSPRLPFVHAIVLSSMGAALLPHAAHDAAAPLAS